jgi:heme oxygenase
VYAVLEPALTRLSTDPVIAPIYMPRIARLEALERDLVYWGGAQWRSLAIVPGAESYRVRLAALAVGDPALLVAHAYVRYLGDLSGGQILAGRITALFGTIGQGVAFYGFGTEDVGALRERYRDGLDAIPLDQGARVRVIGEALEAFALHERMFTELG